MTKGISTLCVIAQLEEALSQAEGGLARVQALNAWCWEGWCNDPQLAWQRAHEARQLAYQQLSDQEEALRAVGHSLLNIAHLLIRMNKPKAITSELEDAAMIFKHFADEEGQLRCEWLRALQALALGKDEHALAQLVSLLHEPITLLYPHMMGRVQMLMGAALVRMGELRSAQAYFKAACETFQRAGDPLLHGQAMALWTLLMLPHEPPQETITRAQQALPLQKQQIDWYSRACTIRAMAYAYLQLKDVASARHYASKFVMIAQYIESILSPHYRLMLQAKVEYAEAEHDERKLALAKIYMDLALPTLGRLTNPHEIIELCEVAAMIYAKFENYEWAGAYIDRIRSLEREMRLRVSQRHAQAVCNPHLFSMYRRTAEQQPNEALPLEARLDALKRLLDMFSEVSSNLNVAYVTSLSLDAAMRLTNAEAGFFAVADEDRGVWHIHSILGAYPAADVAISPTLEPVLRARRVALLDSKQVNVDGLPTLPTSQARILVPLCVGDRLVGLLNVETTNVQRFNANVYELMETMQSFVVIALENALLYERLAQQNHELAASLAQVTRLETFKTDMIRLASHDLKQPLTVLKLYLSMIQPIIAPHLTATQASYLDAIANAIHTMDRLTTDILSLERIEQIAFNLPDTVFDLAEIVRHEVELVQVQASQRQQALQLIADVPQALMRGDDLQLREAVSNLIGNALKYTPDGGQITVRLYATLDQIHLEVADNGIGIAPADLPHIFEPSYRVNSEQTRRIGGTGWGLYLVKKIVETHRGQVECTSELGKGSTFFVRLPRAAPSLSAKPDELG